MRLMTLPQVEFNLDRTLHSGQVFHWEKYGPGYLGAIGNTPVYVEERKGRVVVESKNRKLATDYFALDHELPLIYESFPKDAAMSKALEACRGLRIIRQPEWECLATFITSAMKQVAHIRQISLTLRKRFGRRLEYSEAEVYSYPSPEKIASLNEAELRKCALGYRAGHLLKTARAIAEGKIDLKKLRKLETIELRKKLCEFAGVGEKIANCVLLFGYERLGAVPIDVWIAQVLRVLYFEGKESIRLPELAEFSERYFGPYSGYAQQYLFHHARVTFKRSRTLASAADWAKL